MKKSSNRDVALMNGQLYYDMDRPCSRGHVGKRYTSCGLCVQCVAQRTATQKQQNKEARQLANAKKFDKASVYSTIVRAYQRPGFEALTKVCTFGTREQADTAIEFLTMLADQVITPAAARPADELDRSALAALVCLDPHNLCNADGTPLVQRFDEHDALYIVIAERPYLATELAACWRGERATVRSHRVTLHTEPSRPTE